MAVKEISQGGRRTSESGDIQLEGVRARTLTSFNGLGPNGGVAEWRIGRSRQSDSETRRTQRVAQVPISFDPASCFNLIGRSPVARAT